MKPLAISYLMTPYSHKSLAVRTQRTVIADAYAAKLMEQGEIIFSPITHGHRVEPHMSRKGTQEFWMRQCIAMLKKSNHAYLLPQPGWRESAGVKQELAFCRSAGIPVTVLRDKNDSSLEYVSGHLCLAEGWDLKDFL